jgi:hypothetical protein
MAADEMMVEIRVADRSQATDIVSALDEHGGHDVSLTEEQGIVDLLPYVIYALVAVAGFAEVALGIRARTRCQQIIDVRSKTVKSSVDCSIRDGRIIIIAPGGRVTIHEPEKLVNLNQVIAAAMRSAKAAHELASADAPTTEISPTEPDREA